MLVVLVYNEYDFLSLSTLTGFLSAWAIFTCCVQNALIWQLLSHIKKNSLECLIWVFVVCGSFTAHSTRHRLLQLYLPYSCFVASVNTPSLPFTVIIAYGDERILLYSTILNSTPFQIKDYLFVGYILRRCKDDMV
jgi:hypothetical protein